MQSLLRECLPHVQTCVVHGDGDDTASVHYCISLSQQEHQQKQNPLQKQDNVEDVMEKVEENIENGSRLQTLKNNVSEAISSAFRAILPRRCHEPTGPFALVFDMLLSIFIPRGACRSTIEKLPIHIIATSSSSSSLITTSTSNSTSLHHAHSPHISGDSALSPIRIPASDNKCPICLGPFQLGDSARRLGCAHLFHTECIDPWLRKKSLCPICKVDPC